MCVYIQLMIGKSSPSAVVNNTYIVVHYMKTISRSIADIMLNGHILIPDIYLDLYTLYVA